VKRTHEDFKWLYQQIADNCENYAGYLVPSPPGKPDFSNSFVHNEKYNFAVAQMSRYGSGIGGENTQSYGNNKINRKRSDSSASGVSSVSSLRTQTSTDTTNKLLEKLKKNCESEYLASFKKCVTDHETFLIKICNHQLFRTDVNLQHFLESDNFENYKLLTTGKNKKNPFSSFLNKVVQYSDEQIFRTTPHRGSLMNRSLDSSHTSGVSSLNTSGISSNSSSNSFQNNPSPTKTQDIPSITQNSNLTPHEPSPPNNTNLPIHNLSVQDIFNQYYVYFDDKLRVLERMVRIGDGCYRKQKELGQFCDWLNESLVHVYKEQKLTETQNKTAFSQLQNHSTLLPSIQALYKATLQESRAQNRLANDLDLNLNLNFKTILNDSYAAKSMLYKRLKTDEKLSSARKQFENLAGSSSSLNSNSSSIEKYETQILRYKVEAFEKELGKFNDIGRKELIRQEEEQIRAIPKILNEHARLQYKKHCEMGAEITELVERLDWV